MKQPALVDGYIMSNSVQVVEQLKEGIKNIYF